MMLPMAGSLLSPADDWLDPASPRLICNGHLWWTVTDRQTTASATGKVGSRSMGQHVRMQGELAGLQGVEDGLAK